MKTKIIKVVIVSLFFSFGFSLFAETNTPAPYEEDEFPQGLKDLRRFEIITLGSLPFVMMDTSLVFSTVEYATSGGTSGFPTPFPSREYESFSDFITDPMILTSIGISVGIGLTDYIVRLIKRNNKKSRELLNNDINIIPIEEDPQAVKIEPPSKPEPPQDDFDEVQVVDPEYVETEE